MIQFSADPLRRSGSAGDLTFLETLVRLRVHLLCGQGQYLNVTSDEASALRGLLSLNTGQSVEICLDRLNALGPEIDALLGVGATNRLCSCRTTVRVFDRLMDLQAIRPGAILIGSMRPRCSQSLLTTPSWRCTHRGESAKVDCAGVIISGKATHNRSTLRTVCFGEAGGVS